ncbi:hypothetical protein P7C70_g1979, partial [Phenoliferia sp. Uapishka_3]
MPYLELPDFRTTVFYIINGSIPSMLVENAPGPESGKLDPDLPNLFWVHGSTSTLSTFEPQWSCSKFRKRYNMISVDAPFMGRSVAEERETWTVQVSSSLKLCKAGEAKKRIFRIVREPLGA